MTTKSSTVPSESPDAVRTRVLELIGVAALFAAIGVWYAGPSFLQNFATAIPLSPSGGGLGTMTPGDQFEQFYRHMLPYFNALRGNPLYYSGYEYNLGGDSSFTEGLMFFPFSLIASILALLVGPIVAYNVLAILSFSFCAVAGYLLGKRVSNGAISGGLVAAAVCALLPFRVSFLFGEMLYGTDFVLLPLSLYLFLAFLEERTWKLAAAFGASIIFFATANFALLYWYSILFLPLFIFGTALVVRAEWANKATLLRMAVAAAFPLLLACSYLLYVKGLLDHSGLVHGQNLLEVRFYSPGIENVFTRWSGNEKSIYLGASAILAVLGGVLFFFRQLPLTIPGKVLVGFSVFMLPFSYALSMGLTFDDLTGIPFYSLVFEHLPGASDSRTPGRIIPIAALCAAVLAAIAVGRMGAMISGRSSRVVFGLCLVGLLAVDFHFSSATMSKLDSTNGAYATLSKQPGTAIAIPFQREADHYLNATFQFFAVTHDVALVNGHSSMYPVEWAALYPKISVLNSGVATRDVLNELRSRGVRFIIAHNTQYEPKVSRLAVRALDQNKALQRVGSDEGIVAYEIEDPQLAPLKIGLDYFAKIAGDLSEGDPVGEVAPFVTEVTGWYSREAYVGQKPFRWMAGTSSILFVHPGTAENAVDLVFQYKCPYGSLSVMGGGLRYTESPAELRPGWTTVKVDVRNGVDSAVELSTPSVYLVPNDSREFGCMVGDFKTR